MPNKPHIDISGRRFGRLIAIKRLHRGNGTTMWLCRCDCGNETITGLQHLKSGNTRSCGCFRSEERSRNMKAWRGPCQCSTITISKKYTYYKRNAKRRGHVWNLTPADFEQLLSEPCFYCDAKDNNGIDRVDCNFGYDYSNIVTCCTSCNQAKNDKNIAEFATWVRQVYAFLDKTEWDKDEYATLVRK